jgi:hypothetical protein
MYADMGHFGRVPIRLAWFARPTVEGSEASTVRCTTR